MATETLSPSPFLKFWDNNAIPLAFGLVFTYAAGTSTKIPTYTDSTGGTPNPNPVKLDAKGEGSIWIPPNVSYKYVISPSTDTDPPTNAIKTIDQIVNNQLLTLYGGVDTGIVNAYILTSSNLTPYVDGLVIYWIPSNTNTGASTINVNGLGVIPIVNGDGSAMLANELPANQIVVIMYKGGNFVLVNSPYSTSAVRQVNVQNSNYTFQYSDAGKIIVSTANSGGTWTIPANVFSVGTFIDLVNVGGAAFGFTVTPAGGVTLVQPFANFGTGSFVLKGGQSCRLRCYAANSWMPDNQGDASSFTCGWTGFSVNPTTTIGWARSAGWVTLYFPGSTGTSNATSWTMTGLPANLQPASSRYCVFPQATDNSVALTTFAQAIVSGSTVTFFKDAASGAWTNTGSKGFQSPVSISYSVT